MRPNRIQRKDITGKGGICHGINHFSERYEARYAGNYHGYIAGVCLKPLDLGFAEGAGIRCLFRSMFGDPTAYEICGTVIALRAGDSASVFVRLPHEAKT